MQAPAHLHKALLLRCVLGFYCLHSKMCCLRPRLNFTQLLLPRCQLFCGAVQLLLHICRAARDDGVCECGAVLGAEQGNTSDTPARLLTIVSTVPTQVQVRTQC